MTGATGEEFGSQYNPIQTQYDCIRTKSISFIEKENVQTAVAPFIRNASVLELACGSGFYSFDLLKWGAKSVVAVDFSPEMVAGAERKKTADQNVKFIVGDVSKPVAYSSTQFDFVFGAWPLDYAPDRKALVDMFRNVSLNLRPEGHFVCVTWPPTQDPRAMIERSSQLRPGGAGGLKVKTLEDLEHGVLVRLFGSTAAGDVSFDSIFWRKDVYEAAAREGGMTGTLTWAATAVPERYKNGDGPGGADLSELETYAEAPNYGILTVAKEG